MKRIARAALVLTFAGSIVLAGCDTPDPTSAIIDNTFPAAPDGGDPSRHVVVFKAWWSVTLFPDPIAAGASSDENRVVPASDVAYALLAPNWDPSSPSPPPVLLPVRTKSKLTLPRGETTHIAIGESTVDGDCASGSALTQEEADFITQRIFPGDFANVTYDARTCVSTPVARDAGEGETNDGG